MKMLVSKKVSLYGFLTAAALLFGYVEYLVPLNFIAPGIKVGISNGVILILILNNKPKAAIMINIARILLSGLLFASPFSLIFSLSAGLISTLVMIILSKFKSFGIIGISALGGIIHNIVQILVAKFTVGNGVFFYLPYLLLAGTLAGVVIGLLVSIILKKIIRKNILEEL